MPDEEASEPIDPDARVVVAEPGPDGAPAEKNAS
jgi:hypothetical protein